MTDTSREVPPADDGATAPLIGRAAIALYPSWWRDRYGEDQLGFLADLRGEGRSVAQVLPNLFAGALRARISGTGMPATPPAWRYRTRSSALLATLAAMPLVALGFGAIHQGFYSSGRAQLSTAGRVAQDARDLLGWACLIMVLVLIYGWRILLGQARELPAAPSAVATSPPSRPHSSPSGWGTGCGWPDPT